MTDILRSVLAAVGAAALLLAGCAGNAEPTSTGSTGATHRSAAEPASGFLDPAKANEALQKLVAESRTDSFNSIVIQPHRVRVVLPAVPGANRAESFYVAEDGAVTVEEYPHSFTPLAQLSLDEIDLEAALATEKPCSEALASFAAIAPGLHAMTWECPDVSVQKAYWLSDLSPVGPDVADAASLQAIVDRVDENVEGVALDLNITDKETVENPDGSTTNDSLMAIWMKINPQAVFYLHIQEEGSVIGDTLPGSPLDGFPLSELDLAGLLACKAKVHQEKGEAANRVSVSRNFTGEVGYQWTPPGQIDSYFTDANCQPR